MLAASSGVAAAIGSVTYRMKVQVQVTLPGNVLADASLTVDALTIDASLTTDMPDGIRIQAGYPAVTCDLTLSGNITYSGVVYTAGKFFNPYNTGSPIYRTSILGSGVTAAVSIIGGTSTEASPEWLPKFTGAVDSITVDPVAGTVQMSCIDYRNKLRSLPSLSPVITEPPFNAGLTSEFAVDHLLRQATDGVFSSWPAQRAHCVLAAGMRASLWPEVGALDTDLSQPSVVFVPGPYGTGLGNTNSFDSSEWGVGAVYTLAGSISNHLFIECFVSDVTIASLGELDINVGALSGHALGETLLLQIASDGVSATIPGAGSVTNFGASLLPGPHYVGVHFAFSGGSCTATGTVDGATFTHTVTFTGTPSTWTNGTISGADAGAIAGVQVTTESSPTPNNGFVPQAVLSASLNALQVIPAISGDPWQVIQQIADAEQAVAGFTPEDGIFRFTNRTTLASSSSVRQVTSSTSLKSMQISTSQASVYDSVTVPYTGWTFKPAGLLYALSGTHGVDPGETKTWTVQLPDGTLIGDIDNNASVLSGGHSTTDGNSWFRASRDVGGLDEYTSLTVTLTPADASHITIAVKNTGGHRGWLISPANKIGGGTYTDIAAGTPSLWIGGIPVEQADEQTVTYPVGAAGTNLSLDSNPWIQDDDTAAQLAFDLYDDLTDPRPDLTSVEIVPDPRLQLGDRIEIVDPDTSGVDEYAVLWGWTLTLSDTDWSQTVDCRTVAAPGQWILDVDGRSELDDTTWI